MLREDIGNLTQHMNENNDETKKIFIPSIQSDFNQLVNLVTMQKHENLMLNKQLHDLQKEKILIEQNVLAFQGRIQILEDQIGK